MLTEKENKRKGEIGVYSKNKASSNFNQTSIFHLSLLNKKKKRKKIKRKKERIYLEEKVHVHLEDKK